MRIKTKISLGVGLLFILIALMAVVSTFFVNKQAAETQDLHVDNFNTLNYARHMLMALEQSTENPAAASTVFDENLKKQRANITEPGESEVTESLTDLFGLWQKNPADTVVTKAIRADLYAIMQLNANAIARKTEVAKATSIDAITWIAITGTLCFLIAFTLLINLPGNIANPIKELTESIRQIAAQNYHQRVHFEEHNEFGDLARAFNKMAKKLEEYNGSTLARIMMEKKRIEMLVNKMHDPVIGLDPDKKVLFANDEALKTLGVAARDIIGLSAQEVALSNDLMRTLVRDLTPKPGNNAPLRIYAHGKESFFEKEVMEINITPTGEIKEEFLGHVVLLRNITPFKELDSAKTNFIATISHELKTPIAAIKMSLQLLENQNTGPLNPEQKQLTGGIAEDANRLLKITGELLNMTQAETGNIQLSILPSPPETILQLATSTVKLLAEQKQIQVEVQLQPELPKVKADIDKTVWVLVNLLTNAIHYSSEQATIVVEVYRDNGNVIFGVKDSGKGIDKRYRERVFDRYFQVPGSPKTGTGLGLAICKEFIEAQGGTIGVETEVGMGSRFYFGLEAV